MGKYCNRAEVDTAVMRLCDPSLQAEIWRLRGTQYRHQMLEKQINQLEGELYAVRMRKSVSTRWLMAANAKAQVEAK